MNFVWCTSNSYPHQLPVGSLVAETAVHSQYGGVLPEPMNANCEITKRCANWSYTTTGSPRFSDPQCGVPGKSVLIVVGGTTCVPVFVQAANCALTTWT